MKYDKQTFIKKANEIHSNLYDYSKFHYVNIRTKGKIICKKHGNFEQVAAVHLQGHGCSKCSKERVDISNRLNGEKNRLTKEIFVERANSIHNNFYNYDLFDYVQSTIKGIIKCSLHGEFKQSPNSHLLGHGCSKCAKQKTAEINRLDDSQKTKNKTLFVEQASAIHSNYYEYGSFQYINSATKGDILCPFHGIFKQSPNTHLKGHGCPKCGRRKSSINNRYTTEEFVVRANFVHENRYLYSDVIYITEHQNIIIECKIHGKFKQTPNNHIYGMQGCPKCSYRISKPGTKWLDLLNVREREYTISLINGRTRKVDGYDPETNTAYEFHGDYWHGNPEVFDLDSMNERTKCSFRELYEKTLEHDKLIRESGYNLVILWEKDYYDYSGKFRILWENNDYKIIIDD